MWGWGPPCPPSPLYQTSPPSFPLTFPLEVNLAIALTDLGTRIKLLGRAADSIALYERALSYNSKYTDAMYNLGVAFAETGQVRQSGSCRCGAGGYVGAGCIPVLGV